jgi:hypothetical protein
MTETSDLEKRLGDLERRHEKTREFLIDVLSFAVSMLAAFHFQPEGLLAFVGVIWGTMLATNLLAGWLLKQRMKERKINYEFLTSACVVLLILLSVAIHLITLLVAPSTFTGLVATLLLPGIAEAYWIWAIWAATGALSQPLTQLCAAWVVLLGIWFLVSYMFAHQRPLQSH